ncbi:MAG TPA: hypothetical protein PKA19_06545 [Bacillota bacterium]|nr:hypothetical protein [Bacillota bacterium]
MKKTITNKFISLVLTGVIVTTAGIPFCAVSYAAPPSVSVDEAVYVNLDYYGGVSNVSIVKGCDLNGNSAFTDYGSYESVTNMSGYDKPVLTADGVKWNLNKIKDHQRFYFDGTLKNNTIEFPWTFDVSYKLDGVPARAEDLAGVSGLIEININAAPNEKAKEYHKNNMLLQVAAYIDMEDTYSLDAPGSQLQSVGSKKAVVFSALPGEAETFTIRVGTNSFENQGITMMMMPGTLEQFKDIKDLKEAKDTLEDSSDAIYTSINEILRTMESMNSGLSELKSGTAGLEEARSNFSSGKDQMNQDFDKTIEDLNAVNEQLQTLIPYFETGKRMIRSINNDIEDITDTLEEYEDPLNDTDDSITVIQSDLAALRTALNTLSSQMNDMLTNMSAAAAVPGGAALYDIAELQGEAAMAAALGSYMDEISSLLTETIKLGDTAKDVIGITNDLIDDMEDAGDTFDRYEDDMINLLDDTEQLTTLVNSSLSSTIVYLSYSKTLIQQTGDILDPAMEKSLKAIIDLLDKSLQNMDDITALKKANSTIKNTVDEQFDKFEDENKFLNLDAEAPLQSFTSDKNPPPATVQVILRTQEISLDSADNNKELETEKEDKGLLARIIDIFIEIKDKITGLL